MRRSPITDDMEALHFSTFKRKKYASVGIIMSMGLAVIAISLLSCIIILRSEITNDLFWQGIDMAGPVCALLNAISI